MLDDILKELREQLAMYKAMSRREREETGGESYGTCAYLDGAMVASQRALELVERAKASVSLVSVN